MVLVPSCSPGEGLDRMSWNLSAPSGIASSVICTSTNLYLSPSAKWITLVERGHLSLKTCSSCSELLDERQLKILQFQYILSLLILKYFSRSLMLCLPFHLYCSPALFELPGSERRRKEKHFHVFPYSCRQLESETLLFHSLQT